MAFAIPVRSAYTELHAACKTTFFEYKNKDAGKTSVLTHMHNTQTQSITTIFRLYEKHTITAQSLIQQQLVLYAQNQIK